MNTLTIYLRELKSYFAQPTAYAIIISFLSLSLGFTFTFGNFIRIGDASLSYSFFFWHSWLFIFIAPAVGMKLWADEQRNGTIELLGTFPISTWSAILGKFLAACTVTLTAIALTFPIVITVNYLGDPDNGIIISGYIGSFLTAATFIAITMLVSACTRDQVVCLIASVAICTVMVLCGYDDFTRELVKATNPATVEGFVAIGIWDHISSLNRGLLRYQDFIWFVSIIAICLLGTSIILNGKRLNIHLIPSLSILTKIPLTRSTLAIAALIAIGISSNWLISLTPYGNRGIDFTENKIHTLSKGTKAILGELDTDVVIRYYASRSTDYMPEQVKVHMKRVDNLLKEYVNLSNGKLRIEHLDPLPDTDAEDSANLDEISGSRINNDNLFFGLAVTALDKKVTIPFLDPNDETMLEYNVSKAIADVSTAKKPVIGIISAFELAGSPGMPMMGQQGKPAWIIYEQLTQSYEVKDLGLNPEKIDPNEVNALLLFHPAGITKQTEYLIDQYLLQGGTIVACLDAHSIAAQMSGGGNPMMGQQGTPTSSTLPALLPTWGIDFTSDRVLADPIYSTQLDQNRKAIVLLTLPDSAMPQKDNIVTKNLKSVMLYLPGAFKRTGGGVTSSSLIRSSTSSGFVDPMLAARLDPSLQRSLTAEGTPFDLVTYLSGNFNTAFPEGKPKAPDAESPESPDKADEKKEESLKAATKPGNVFLIADVDAFYDDFAYRVQNFGGMKMVNLANGNSSLLLNIIDQAVGSPHLIGSRSRAATTRPFTVIKDMEDKFQKERGAKIKEIEAKGAKTLKRLQELQAQREDNTSVFLSPEQEAEYTKLQNEEAQYNRAIREEEKILQRDKDKLTGRITRYNVAAMPLFVLMLSFGVYTFRSFRTRAR